MQYTVDAIAQHQQVRLTLEAADADDARRLAEGRGLAVVAVSAPRWHGSGVGLLMGQAGQARFPLQHFNQSLLLLLRAGLSIVEAVETLADRESRSDARRVMQQLHGRLLVGLSLSAALAEQPQAFPPLFVASVRANETTGGLVEAIDRFNAYRARAEQLKKRIVGAAIYPALILLVGGAVVAFLLLYVVPRFAVVFEDMGDRIPAMARLLLDWGRFMHAHGTLVLGGLAVLLVLAVWALRRPGVRVALGRLLQRVPRIGDTVHVFQLSRFYRALGLLVQAGMPVSQALELARGLLPVSLHAALAAAQRDISEGRSMSAAFEAQGLATAVARRLFRVAERTGAMGEMLERTATFHDEDIAQATEWFVRLFEPLLMVGIGIVIGMVVLLMYAPIFELAGSLQ